jgi:hypothetical protein
MAEKANYLVAIDLINIFYQKKSAFFISNEQYFVKARKS